MSTLSWMAFLTGAYLFLMLAVGGRRRHGYSHIHHTISELGEVGAPGQQRVALGIFLPVGLALLAIAIWTRPFSEPVSLLALVVAIGYLVAVLFPCDPGSPVSGTPRQAIHNVGGAVQYLGGAYALFRLAEVHGSLFSTAGMVVGGAGLALSFLTAGRGAVQRIAELCLFGGLVAAL